MALRSTSHADIANSSPSDVIGNARAGGMKPHFVQGEMRQWYEENEAARTTSLPVSVSPLTPSTFVVGCVPDANDIDAHLQPVTPSSEDHSVDRTDVTVVETSGERDVPR